jgi:hypothetical protein
MELRPSWYVTCRSGTFTKPESSLPPSWEAATGLYPEPDEASAHHHITTRLIVMMNAVFWDVPQCDSCKKRSSSEMSVLTWATLRDIPEDGILHGHSRENIKSYINSNIILLSTSWSS